MLNRPITMPRWRFLLAMGLAFAMGGFAIHHLSLSELLVIFLLAAAIDYGSQRLMRNN